MHPYATILMTWGQDKDHAQCLTNEYLETRRTLSARELQVLVLLDVGDVFKVLTRWYGTQLAPVARAHLVHAIKTDRSLTR